MRQMAFFALFEPKRSCSRFAKLTLGPDGDLAIKAETVA
jgi:hypothetical protein